jgi:hypothetical protein
MALVRLCKRRLHIFTRLKSTTTRFRTTPDREERDRESGERGSKRKETEGMRWK